LPTIPNWRDPLDIDEVDTLRISFLSNFSLQRITEALNSKRDIFEGSTVEKEVLRRQAAILDSTKSISEVVRALARYRLDNRPLLDHRQTGKIPNRDVENIFIWHLAHRCKLSPRSAK
jgi:hypothetical protein